MASIRVSDLGITFTVYQKNEALSAFLVDQIVGGLLRRDRRNRVEVISLDGVTFELSDGDRLAIVGRNGAGKSTLLRAIAGIYRPTRGKIEIEGTCGSMLDRNLGMDPDATGLDNIRLRLGFLGLKSAEIDACIAEIAEFTELGDFLKLPMRTYSTGMGLRLSFALATAIPHDILVLDEWIGAGDAEFRKKVDGRLKAFVDRSSIMVLATHSKGLAMEVCNKGLWLDRGKVKAFGDLADVYKQMSDAAKEAG